MLTRRTNGRGPRRPVDAFPGRPESVSVGRRRRPATTRIVDLRRALLGGALAVLLAAVGAVPATADPGADCPPAQTQLQRLGRRPGHARRRR